MIIDEIRNIKSGKKDLRNFGFVMAAAFALLGGILLWKSNPKYFYSFIISGLFLFAGSIVPTILKPLHKVWMTFAVLMGWVVSRLILIILFYVILTPLSLIARIFGKQFLERRIDKNASSYWNIRLVEKSTPVDSEKQY